MKGKITAVIGTMFGGKTDELKRKLRCDSHGNNVCILFSKDTRYGGKAKTHGQEYLEEPFTVICNEKQNLHDVHSHCEELISKLREEGKQLIIGIDEGHMWEKYLGQFCEDAALRGVQVIVSGLDTDFQGKRFENMMDVVGNAEEVIKKIAYCVECREPATKNKRIIESEERILQGSSDMYVPLCRRCYYKK